MSVQRVVFRVCVTVSRSTSRFVHTVDWFNLRGGLKTKYCKAGYFRGFQQNRENIMTVKTILMIYLLRKYSKLSNNFRSQSAEISCPRMDCSAIRENNMSYSRFLITYSIFIAIQLQRNVKVLTVKVRAILILDNFPFCYFVTLFRRVWYCLAHCAFCS